MLRSLLSNHEQAPLDPWTRCSCGQGQVLSTSCLIGEFASSPLEPHWVSLNRKSILRMSQILVKGKKSIKLYLKLLMGTMPPKSLEICA